MAVEERVEVKVAEFAERFDRLRREIGRVVVGHDEVVRGVVACVLVGGHALLEGVPGIGKTLTVRTVASALDLEFSRIQFTPDLMPADITGTNVLVEGPDGRKRFEFQPGPLFANIVLADEINRATPKTQSALLEAMQERAVTVAGARHPLPEPFVVLATQNPIEMEGTFPLPEAQLDRFMLKLKVEFPSEGELAEILDRTTGPEEPRADRVATREEVMEMRRLARGVVLPGPVRDYVARLVMATHPEHPSAPDIVRRFVRYGASPRGGQALVLFGKVLALLRGGYNVSFDDVRQAALPALRHRVILNFEGQAEGIDPDEIVRAVLEAVPLPGEERVPAS